VRAPIRLFALVTVLVGLPALGGAVLAASVAPVMPLAAGGAAAGTAPLPPTAAGSAADAQQLAAVASAEFAAGRAGQALRWALARVGTPYRWGGTGDGGFDCSGLVQAAYAAAGVHLPRVAQAQFDAGPRLGARTRLAPGDLVFFGAGPRAVSHVGLYLADGEMVDAPHTGAVVRVEPLWSTDYVGATRPA